MSKTQASVIPDAKQAFHQFTDTPCGRAMARCEKSLARPLGHGEMVDFLLDNFMTIANCDEAEQIRDTVVVYFGRTTLGIYSGVDGFRNTYPAEVASNG